MASLGDFDTSAVIYGKFATFRPSTGATFTLGGTPALSVYKDNSVTQSTTGVTLTVDFDGVTGLNHFAIDTSADGTFYAAGSFFDIVVTTGTVDAVSVTGSVVGSFTLRKDSSLKPTTAGRTLVVDASGLADANTVKLGPTGSGTAQTARDIGTSVLLSAGSGTGQLDFTSGVVKANLAQILGTALTETAGLLAGGFKKFFNVSSPTGTLNSIPDAVAGATGGLFIAGTNAATTVTTALTTTFTGSLTGSVASVTGAVASVTARVTANMDQVDGAALTAHAAGKVPADVLTIAGTAQTARDIGASVIVATNNDKSGYSLTQTFPSNFSTTVISAAGIVDVNVKKIDGVTILGDGSATPFTV